MSQQWVVTTCYVCLLHICTRLCVSRELRSSCISPVVCAVNCVLVRGPLGLPMRLWETTWVSLGSWVRRTCARGYVED